MRYRVALVHEVDAPHAQSAIETALGRSQPTTVRITEASRGRRHGLQDHYDTPLAILDAVWEEYLDRLALSETDADRTLRRSSPRMPSRDDLARAGLDDSTISLLFDFAIAAYRRVLTSTV